MKSAIALPKIEESLKSSDGVVEVLDFVTIVGILLISFGIIWLAGYPLLKNAQQSRYVENTRLSFIVLADNINKVALGQAPSQSVELKMYGGTLKVKGGSPIKINLTKFNSTTHTNEEITVIDQPMGSIENSIGDTVVAYEGTGVWIKYPGGSTLNIYRPVITKQDNVIVLPVVKVYGLSALSGTGMSRVTVKGLPGLILYDNVSKIKITTNSSYQDGWSNYFKELMWDNCAGSECTGQLNTSDSDVYILNTQIDTVIV